MKVSIQTPMGSKAYDMEDWRVAQLLYVAYRLADGNEEKPEDKGTADMLASARYTVQRADELLSEAEVWIKEDESPAPSGHGSRTERMFGKRETWESRSENTDRPAGWKGFLIIRCPDCGEVRTFFARDYQTSHRCRCGCEIELADLIPAYVNCGKCGKRLKYRTNIKDDYPVTVNCLDCKAPIDMAVNARGTAMVPVEELRNHGGVDGHDTMPYRPRPRRSVIL